MLVSSLAFMIFFIYRVSKKNLRDILQLPRQFLWQYEPQGHFFLIAFFLNEALQMWQPMATFLDVISEVPVVLVVHRRGRFSAEESMSSVRRGYI